MSEEVKQQDIVPTGEEEAVRPEPAETAEDDSPEALLKIAERQRDEYLDMAQRVQAEFENYRRRTQSVQREAFDDGAKAFIKTILPVCDNLERAIDSNKEASPFQEGVQLVLKQLLDALEKRGVTPIDRAGLPFDPKLEDAVMQGSPDEGEPGTVCAVVLKGYQMGDSVLRHAMVKVVPD